MRTIEQTSQLDSDDKRDDKREAEGWHWQMLASDFIAVITVPANYQSTDAGAHYPGKPDPGGPAQENLEKSGLRVSQSAVNASFAARCCSIALNSLFSPTSAASMAAARLNLAPCGTIIGSFTATLLRTAPSIIKRRYKRSRNGSRKSPFYSSNKLMTERNLAYQLWHWNRRRGLI